MHKYYLLISVVIFFASCNTNPSDNSTSQVDLSGATEGERLAKLHCGSCHQYVEPKLLDKRTWENRTLPEMGLRMGIGDVFSKNVLQTKQGNESLVELGIYPLTPTISEEDYQKIVNFYLTHAPEESLPQENKDPLTEELEEFEYIPIIESGKYRANITAIGFDTDSRDIILASPKGGLAFYNLSWKDLKTDLLANRSVFSAIKKINNNWFFLDIGRLGPHEAKLGRILKKGDKSLNTILDQLHKPADFTFMDVNEDGVDDFVVCNFGFETGSLAWYDGKTGEEHLLKNIPGARNVHIEDMDGDGKKDIVVLYAQALEGISIFYNKGKGKFKEQEILSFSPVYGSSWFELADFNNDGKKDILYVNGDNADYSFSYKNYHGIRVFENKGNSQFEQTYFYPMYGATKAHAVDFKGNGQLDIVAIAYYRKDPIEGFVYLENKSNYKFKPKTFSESAYGQWMIMELGDVDGDGSLDIILGGNDLARPNKAGDQSTEVVILRNKR